MNKIPFMKKNISLKQIVTEYLQKFFQDHNDELEKLNLHKCVLGEIEEVLINLSLKAANYNQSKAAKILGINRHTIKNKMKEFNIEVNDQK